MYEVFLTHEARDFYEQADPSLVRKLNRCFRHLRENPHGHPNIKRLKGPLAGHFRYRVGDWRVIYQVDEQEHKVTVLLIAHRSKVYR
ncbi:MAG: type II toxin-antitoxin system RelE/ParE family toxin [Chloroflexi bacterium]|nr:type II toxin-antitoxin system RelE/ParE family toxin [Chloroflexota bacterium]